MDKSSSVGDIYLALQQKAKDPGHLGLRYCYALLRWYLKTSHRQFISH